MTPALESWFLRKPYKDARGWREGVYQAVGLPHESQWNGDGTFVCRTWVSKCFSSICACIRCSSDCIRMQFSMWLYIPYECSPNYFTLLFAFLKFLASQHKLFHPNLGIVSDVRPVIVLCGLQLSDRWSFWRLEICEHLQIGYHSVPSSYAKSHGRELCVCVFKGCFLKHVAVCKQPYLALEKVHFWVKSIPNENIQFRYRHSRGQEAKCAQHIQRFWRLIYPPWN